MTKQSENQYFQTKEKYKSLCDGYIRKLETDLKGYSKQNESQGVTYLEPEDKTSIDHITWKKRQVFKDALLKLENPNKTANENIEAFKSHLSLNTNDLSLRRDSISIKIAKQIFSLGMINVYRWIKNDKVTRANRLLDKMGVTQRSTSLTTVTSEQTVGSCTYTKMNASFSSDESSADKKVVSGKVSDTATTKTDTSDKANTERLAGARSNAVAVPSYPNVISGNVSKTAITKIGTNVKDKAELLAGARTNAGPVLSYQNVISGNVSKTANTNTGTIVKDKAELFAGARPTTDVIHLEVGTRGFVLR